MPETESQNLTVSEVARRLNCPPRQVSDVFYQRRVDESRCPIVGHRRKIPADMLPTIREAIERKGT